MASPAGGSEERAPDGRAESTTTGFATVSAAIGQADNYTRWIVERFAPFVGGRVLEVGLGHANYRPHYARVESYVGVDIDAAVVEHARARLPGDTFRCVDLCAPSFPEAVGAGFDVALCLNALQYVADERLAIEHLLAAVRIGGHVCLLLPAHEALLGPMDALSHQARRYSRAGVERLIPHLSAETVRLEYLNPLGALSWWASNLMPPSSLEGDDTGRRIALYDSVVVPLSRGLDPITRGLFGLSLVCVLRRTR